MIDDALDDDRLVAGNVDKCWVSFLKNHEKNICIVRFSIC